MNHFSLFVNLLGWSTRSLGPEVTEISSCSLDMASLILVTVYRGMFYAEFEGLIDIKALKRKEDQHHIIIATKCVSTRLC